LVSPVSIVIVCPTGEEKNVAKQLSPLPTPLASSSTSIELIVFPVISVLSQGAAGVELAVMVLEVVSVVGDGGESVSALYVVLAALFSRCR
jgi:uncharacterized membrane protein